MKAGWSRYLVYVSLAFLLLWLADAGLLKVPRIVDGTALGLSLLLLLAGFFASVTPWWRLLSLAGFAVPLRDATASVGLTIFGKYIPGKIWTILGRANYVAAKNAYPLSGVSAVSLNTQMLMLWAGLLLGSLAFFGSEAWAELGWSALGVWVLLTALVFTDSVNRGAARILRKLTRRTFNLPTFRVGQIASAVPLVCLVWTLWSLGFWFLVCALSDTAVPPLSGFAFALAGTLGILSVFTPGGLGVREGTLAVLLTAAGLPVGEAATISVTSRLWFLIGELSIFLAGMIVDLGRAGRS